MIDVVDFDVDTCFNIGGMDTVPLFPVLITILISISWVTKSGG